MNAAWYEKQGPARHVLVVGTLPDPEPGPGEVRIRIAASGINPGDVKKRQDYFGYGMPYPGSSRTATGPGSSTWWATACPRHGWENGCGATGRRATAPSARPPSTRW